MFNVGSLPKSPIQIYLQVFGGIVRFVDCRPREVYYRTIAMVYLYAPSTVPHLEFVEDRL